MVSRRARPQDDGKGARGMRISTKSGFERRMENNKRGAIAASRNRKAAAAVSGNVSDTGSWAGLDD